MSLKRDKTGYKRIRFKKTIINIFKAKLSTQWLKKQKRQKERLPVLSYLLILNVLSPKTRRTSLSRKQRYKNLKMYSSQSTEFARLRSIIKRNSACCWSSYQLSSSSMTLMQTNQTSSRRRMLARTSSASLLMRERSSSSISDSRFLTPLLR